MRGRVFKATAACAAAILYCLVGSASARADGITYHRVVGKGDAAPGTAAGITFSGFAPPGISPTGQVVFAGALAGPGVNDSNGVGGWAGVPGSLALVMRKGSPAPGTNTTYGPLGGFAQLPPPVDSGGSVAFSASLNSGTPVDNGTWAGPPGGLVLVERFGEPAPGAGPGALFTGILFTPTLNEGRVAFTGEMHGAVTDTNRQAIWAGPPTAIDMVARTGSPAPGANGATFESLGGDPLLNAVGAVAFNGRLAGPGVTGTNADGIWLGPAGALQLAVRAGTAAPGTNKTFAAVGPSGLNARNQIVFAAQLLDGQGRLDGGSIWAGAPGSLRLVAEGGSPAPGTGGTFIALITQPGINDLGQVVFTGTADRGNGNFINGIWAGTPDALSRVALVGDAAPIGGTVPAHFSFVESPWINNAGQVAFVASVDADDGSFENKLSVWVRDALGLLHLVAREGGTIDVNGQPLTIRVLEVGAEIGFGAGGTGAGRPAPFNDAGQLVFQAYFETDTALFVATVPVPEPGALAGLAGCGLLLPRPSRRRRS